MYPQRQLTALAWHKARLAQRIALRRDECAGAARRLGQPLAWLDRTLIFWRQLAPVAAVPLGLLLGRALFPRRGILRAFARWGPAMYGALRGLRSFWRNR